jgi:quercetin dioxygenase-like cupin family protein
VLEGEVEITVSGKPCAVKEGELHRTPAQPPHALKALTRFKMILHDPLVAGQPLP